MSTVQGMFNDRDVEARFAPDGCERLGPGHYRRKSSVDRAVDEMHEAMRDPIRASQEATWGDSPSPPRLATPLEVIASQIRTMPYGDVVTLAQGTGTDPSKLWDWATK